jgi:hypothetical protein
MTFQFIRNIHFTRLVKADDRLREFNFRKLGNAPEQFFHVDVSDDRGNRIVFKMRKSQNNQWEIVSDQLPRWISNSEKDLNDLIEEELR